jgi:mannose-1-phosphate guanylyltransferase
LQPLTFETPKPMLKVAGIPFTEHQIAKAKAAGVDEIVLATSYLSEVFKPYFGNGERFGIKIKYSVEESALGTGGGIRKAADQLGDCDLVVIFNGDVLSAHDLSRQIKFHLTEVSDARAYGSVELLGNSVVESFNEKMDNPPSNLINAGCYIFNRNVINKIEPNKVVSVERETFPQLLKSGHKVLGFVDRNYWLDIGNPQALVKASSDIVTGEMISAAFDRKKNAKSDSLIKSDVQIGANVVIDSGTVIEDGAVIGENCQIKSSIIGRNAKVEPNCQIESSIVADSAHITSGTIIINNYVGFSQK